MQKTGSSQSQTALNKMLQGAYNLYFEIHFTGFEKIYYFNALTQSIYLYLKNCDLNLWFRKEIFDQEIFDQVYCIFSHNKRILQLFEVDAT